MFGNHCYKPSFKPNFQLSFQILQVRDFSKQFALEKMKQRKQVFLKLSFAKKVLDAVSLGNIIHHTLVQSKIPPFFKYQSVPINTTNIFNEKHVLQDLNSVDFKSKPPDCTCASSPFIYNPAGHVITGDLNIVNDISL